MALYHRWLCNEGTGNIVADSVGGSAFNFTPISGDQVNWGSGKVFGVDRSFVTLGYSRYPRYDGLLQASVGLGDGIPNWSLCMVGRIISEHRNGACLNLGNMHYRVNDSYHRFEQVNIVNSARTIATEADPLYGVWAVIVIVYESNLVFNCYVNNMVTYLNQMVFPYGSGNMGGTVLRMMSHQDDNFPGGMELADVSIYDHQLSEAERQAYADSFFATLPTPYVFEKTNNNDFGGLFRWDEDDGSIGSFLTIENFEGSNVTKHEGDNDTCQMAVKTEIPRSMTEIHCQVDVYLPETLDCNHDFGDIFKIMGLYDGNAQYSTNEYFAYRCIHNLPANTVTLNEVMYQNTTGIYTSALDGTLVTTGVWHTFRMKVDRTAGTIEVWYDGESKLSLTGLTLDLAPRQMYWGLALGAHPQLLGNYFYTRDHYVAAVQKSSPGGGGGSSKQFKRNALEILYDEERN